MSHELLTCQRLYYFVFFYYFYKLQHGVTVNQDMLAHIKNA